MEWNMTFTRYPITDIDEESEVPADYEAAIAEWETSTILSAVFPTALPYQCWGCDFETDDLSAFIKRAEDPPKDTD